MTVVPALKRTDFASLGDGRVRLNDESLHRQVCMAIHKGNHIVFESLPSLIAQIIEHKTWRSYQHKDFASYALDATSNGLGVNTNQRLWILRCSLDVHNAHMKEWAEVLAKVEEMVRVQAAEDGASIKSFGGNSLEMLAKNVDNVVHAGKITYLPSQQKALDGYLVRMRKNKPDVFRRVVAGELSMADARRAARMRVGPTDINRAKSLVRNMTTKERREFIAWLKDEGHLE